MGPAATAVSSIYKELGLTLDEGTRELPDHVMIEWEALAYALERGATQASQALLRDHLSQWMPPFCDAVAQAASEPFYIELAALTSAWTPRLSG
jgi:TorA maturation chaperone TorD